MISKGNKYRLAKLDIELPNEIEIATYIFTIDQLIFYREKQMNLTFLFSFASTPPPSMGQTVDI